MPQSEQFDPTVPRRGGARRELRTQPGSRVAPSGSSRTLSATTASSSEGSRFVLGEELGRGGMGTVRLAEDPVIGRELAIKFLQAGDAGAVEQFVEEAQITGQLQHPNIVPVYDLGRDPAGRPWLAMKRIDGESLADVIAGWKRNKPGRLRQEDYQRVLGIFARVCDAIAFAHSRVVIHRDIKPQNIMVGEFGEVLVVDWGLAKPLGSERPTPSNARPVHSSRRDSDDSHTLDGEVFGTPAYMPPEQAEGRTDEIDERSDIFALGGVLYHMLTLHPPYEGRNATDTLTKAARHRLIPPRRRAPAHGIPKELQAIVLKAMAEKPTARYATVRDLQADLAAWQSFRRTTAWRPGPVERLKKWSRRHPTTTLVASMSMVFSLVVAALISQLQASNATAQLAQESAARAAAERRAAQAIAAEQGARADRAEDRVGELEGIGNDVAALLDERSKESIAEFNRLWAAAKSSGLSDEAFGETLSGNQIEHFLQSYKSLFDVLGTLHKDPTADQCFSRALIRHSVGDLEGAIDDYSAALRIDPQLKGAYNNRGNVWQAQGKLDEAMADYDAVLRINPQSADAYYNRGNVQALRGRLDEAIADFDAAIRINTHHSLAYINRGNVCTVLGRLDEAIADYDAALRINSQDAEAYNNRGNVRAAQGRLEEAINDLDTALRIDPHYAKAYKNRGDARQTQGRLAEAIADYDAAVRLNPQDANAYMGRGRARRAQGKLDEAIADYDAALRINSRYWQAWANRAMATQQSDRDATVNAWQQAYRFCPDPQQRATFAGYLKQLGAEIPK
ncbi:MAG: tetratricopeptide repeat protein [Planctomycetota bacterium]